MAQPRSFVLTTPQIIEAVERLEGLQMHFNTLADWAATGLVVPSKRFDGKRARGHSRLYTLRDLARIRIIARLRRGGLSIQRIRVILAFIDVELKDVLRPNTKAVLTIDKKRVVILRPGHADQEIPSGQLRLPLVEVVRGNRETAAAIAAA